MDGFMVILTLIMLVFYVGVLISYRSTVRDHPYIALATAAFLVAQFILPLETVGPLLIGSAGWAAYDVRKLEVYKYRLGGVTNVITAFIGCWLLWPIFFPWVLINRHMILDGKAKLKGNHRKAAKQAINPTQSNTPVIPPKETSPIPDEFVQGQNNPNVKVVDVMVEEIEPEIEERNEELPRSTSTKPMQTNFIQRIKKLFFPPKNSSSIRWIINCVGLVIGLLFAIGIGIAVIDEQVSKARWSSSTYQNSNFGREDYGQINQASADATYRFWVDAGNITHDWWRLSSSFSDHNNDPDVNLIATLVFLEGAIESLGNLSTQGVDSRATQTIQNVRHCMYNFYSLGCDAVESRNRYGPRLPPAENNRLGMATVGLVIQYGLIQSEYSQTARTLSTAYGRRFPGS